MKRFRNMKSDNGIRIVHTARFFQSVKQLPRLIHKRLTQRDILFRVDFFDPRLSTHKLHGRFKGFWAYSVDFRYRVIFIFRDQKTVVYYDVGLHKIYDKNK